MFNNFKIKIEEVNTMEKAWWKSKTVWGSILLAIQAGLLTLPGSWPYVETILTVLGVFLTGFGFRSAMKK